jgi:hypothetical protein
MGQRFPTTDHIGLLYSEAAELTDGEQQFVTELEFQETTPAESGR